MAATALLSLFLSLSFHFVFRCAFTVFHIIDRLRRYLLPVRVGGLKRGKEGRPRGHNEECAVVASFSFAPTLSDVPLLSSGAPLLLYRVCVCNAFQKRKVKGEKERRDALLSSSSSSLTLFFSAALLRFL